MENNFEQLIGVVPLESAKINDYVQFGKNAWKVIGVEDGLKLLLSKECMVLDFDWVLEQDTEKKATDGIGDDLVDEDFAAIFCPDSIIDEEVDNVEEYEAIRKYFREWFSEKYFTKAELGKIVPHKTVGDHIFLLDELEVEQYLPEKEERIATTSALIKVVERPWLLRLNQFEESQLLVDIDGGIIQLPEGCVCDTFRPAVWVKT